MAAPQPRRPSVLGVTWRKFVTNLLRFYRKPATVVLQVVVIAASAIVDGLHGVVWIIGWFAAGTAVGFVSLIAVEAWNAFHDRRQTAF